MKHNLTLLVTLLLAPPAPLRTADGFRVWKNRLVGDQNLPVESRLTWTFHPFHKAEDSLEESGLLGPVRLLSSAEVLLIKGKWGFTMVLSHKNPMRPSFGDPSMAL